MAKNTTYHFSPSTGAFYPDDINYGDSLPADVIAGITFGEYQKAMARNPDEDFTVNPDGTVTVSPRVIPLAEYRANRKAELTREGNTLVDVQTAASPREQMRLMRKAIRMVDKQANQGAGRNPMLDQLAAASDYADAVEVEEENGHAAIDGAADEAAVDTAYDTALAAMQAVPLPGA